MIDYPQMCGLQPWLLSLSRSTLTASCLLTIQLKGLKMSSSLPHPSGRVCHLGPRPQQQLLGQLLPHIPVTLIDTVVGPPPLLVRWPAELRAWSRPAVPWALFAKEAASWTPCTFTSPAASSAPFFAFVCLKAGTVSRACLSWSGSGEPCGGGDSDLKEYIGG